MTTGIDLEAYLARIGCHAAALRSHRTLRDIQAAHTRAIAFENLDVLLGRPIALEPGAIERKLVHARRGGYCYEQNLLLKAALEALGFAVRGLAARVLWNVPPGTVRPRTHMLLLVEAGALPYVVDAGFGVLTPTAPLRLEPWAVQATSHETYRLVPDGAAFVLQAQLHGAWASLYRFDLTEYPVADYALGNWYVSTHSDSIFVSHLVAARPWAGGRHTLWDNELSTRETGSGQATKRRITSAQELRATLQSVFGLELADADALDTVLAQVVRSGDGAPPPSPTRE